MHPKLKIVDQPSDFEKTWDEKSLDLQKTHPLKSLKTLPKIEGISKKTRKNLRLKAFFYLLRNDPNRLFFRYFLRKPKYIFQLIRSYWKKGYIRDGDFFLYNLTSTKDFETKLKDLSRLFVLGFSYCHKPFECPSGRFSDQCIHDPNHPVCGQCFIGKCCNFVDKKNTKLLFIPTVHYIGEKLLELVEKNKIIFLITACELSLEMFKDFGNMINIEGIGTRLDGRICNTMKAFELSEGGIKPNLTVVLDDTQEKIIHFLKLRKDKTIKN